MHNKINLPKERRIIARSNHHEKYQKFLILFAILAKINILKDIKAKDNITNKILSDFHPINPKINEPIGHTNAYHPGFPALSNILQYAIITTTAIINHISIPNTNIFLFIKT